MPFPNLLEKREKKGTAVKHMGLKYVLTIATHVSFKMFSTGFMSIIQRIIIYMFIQVYTNLSYTNVI